MVINYVHRTANFWIMFMDMIDILRKFIRPERSGNWLLHLQKTFEIQPYLAAAGHNNYTKSIQVYLQEMDLLKEKNEYVYEAFMNGYNVVHRTSNSFCGIPADMAIEQTVMCDSKGDGK